MSSQPLLTTQNIKSQENKKLQEDEEKQKESYVAISQKEQKICTLSAIFWMLVIIFVGAIYTGWHFWLPTIPFALRFTLGKIGTIPYFLTLALIEYKRMDNKKKASLFQLDKEN